MQNIDFINSNSSEKESPSESGLQNLKNLTSDINKAAEIINLANTLSKSLNLSSETVNSTSHNITINSKSNLNIKIETIQTTKTTITILNNEKSLESQKPKMIEEYKSEKIDESEISSNYLNSSDFFSDSFKNCLMKKSREQSSLNSSNPQDIVSFGHSERYFFVCGEVENGESLNSFGDFENEEVLRTVRWVIPEGFKVFFNDKNFLMERSCVSFEEFKNIMNDKRLGFDSVNYELDTSGNMKLLEDEDLIKITDLALKFYFTKKSREVNRILNYILYSSFLEVGVNKNELYLINSYLYFALSMLPLFWGPCTRCVNMTEEDLKIYKPGRIICWLQFTSGTEEKINPATKRNTVFSIYSQFGRKFKYTKNNRNKSKVLFLPLSHFLVKKIEKIGNQIKISLKQIELGNGQQNILWVDDHIHEKSYENKYIIEKSLTYNPSIKFILKSSTETALAYLESIWGQEKKLKPESFRIISDMSRPDEENGEMAGAKFLKEVYSRGFNCKKMIFSSCDLESQQKLEKLEIQNHDIVITSICENVFDFILFK